MSVARRRLPPIAVAAATVLALLAAGLVLAVFDDDSPGGATGDTDDGSAYELTPEGDLPDSVEDVRLVALDEGEDRRLGDLLGERPVVVNFFASWCQPCIDEMPDFEAVHRAAGDEVSIIGMANRDSPEAALGIVDRTGVTYPTYGDPQSSAITYFGGVQMPTTVFIDASGEVVDVHAGALDEGELRHKIDEAFGVPA
jgi:thiol-disulfide isomerase/thioredoxin